MITIIATVLNEADNIHLLLDSLAEQTCLPDEIIIVDGGSTDGTLEIMNDYRDRLPLRILSLPGSRISQGRNAAIAAAQGNIIAATDAGLSLCRHWVECLTAPFLHDADLRVVGGFFEADAHSLFEMAMGAAVSRLPDEIDPNTFLPGSNSIAYRKSDWQAIGAYPEWLDFGEDMVFILKLKQLVGRIAFAPSAVVLFRPRSSLSAFFKQYYHYARGDGKADLWRKRHAIRYLTYLGLVPAIFALGVLFHVLFWGLFLVGGAVYLYQPYRRLYHAIKKAHLKPASALASAALLPLIRLTGDLAKMLGYPAGLYWRHKHTPPDWRAAS
jgi:glycosyltransferase involved in cell wall biosynthesis